MQTLEVYASLDRQKPDRLGIRPLVLSGQRHRWRLSFQTLVAGGRRARRRPRHGRRLFRMSGRRGRSGWFSRARDQT